MEGIEVIKKRRSIRKFRDQHISEEDLHSLLECAMSGPTAVNAQEWEFLVVRDKENLKKMAEAKGKFAELLVGADVGIMVLGNIDKAYEGGKDFWIIDGAIAAQNICLSARALNIGSCMIGVYPMEGPVERLKALYELPEGIMPHTIIALGYALDEKELELGNRSSYDEAKVHYEKY
ncbi:MAG: nitroreductase family protein [Erysipelotrichaceae bacterium]|nr:nitroreductase family protein [Erysipelotrichaceae bacterium]